MVQRSKKYREAAEKIDRNKMCIRDRTAPVMDAVFLLCKVDT